MSRPTRDDIFRLAVHNPIVNQCVMQWWHNDATWEEALTAAVLALADANAKLLTEKLVSMQYAQPSFVINASSDK